MKAILALAVSVFVTSTSAFAQLAGTSDTGTFTPSGGGYPGGNYFDPAFLSANPSIGGFVPAGYANASSPTITIAAGDNTFAYQDAYNLDTADFNGSTLTVTDAMNENGALPWTMTFTDPAFTGISAVSNNFINGGINASISGDVITLQWDGSYGPDEYVLRGTYTADFNVNSSAAAPDGASTIALLGLALAGLGSMKRLKAFAR
jgi:hypothetical protein